MNNDLLTNYLQTIEKKVVSSKVTDYNQIGLVKEIKDGVVLATGLGDVALGELVEFENGVPGQVIDITENFVGIIVLGKYEELRSDMRVLRQKKQASIGVSFEVISRVINPIGEPLDELPPYKVDKYYLLEKIAPGVTLRKTVNVPLETGIKVIDALIPIGRGQRELIIGDRRTGKTTLAIDIIINQKGKNLICIYCAIGQKASKVALTIETLRRFGAMEHTVVVAANASDPASLQYLAPYAACALGEYFMDKGKDVLVIYDDLSKHAWAYRQISLILRRPAGREAYPGDVFYLHSRLLERACRLDEKYGGGSLTALPIIETLEGDVSSYIPTNVISITDGQIFLETDLFNTGIRPAINVGVSVSRVGSSAQYKAMKQVASKLKLDLAQYREMAAFVQFESELDEETRKFIQRGARMTQILTQDIHQPYSLAEEVAIIWVGDKGYLDNVPLEKIKKLESQFLSYLQNHHKKLMDLINKKKIIDDEIEKTLEKAVKEFFSIFEEKL